MVWTYDRDEWKTLSERSSRIAQYVGEGERIGTSIPYYFYLYKGTFYITEISLSNKDATVVMKSELAKNQETLKAQVERIRALSEVELGFRKPIPEDVQLIVWNRDKGKCVNCGSREKLEFDHIIPLSKGGSNTARNIQLLCEKSNRDKGNSIGSMQ